MHSSDSIVQQRAESIIIDGLNHLENLALRSETHGFETGVTIQLDGYDNVNRVICEVYAHIGALKAGHRHKIASDILKLSLAKSLLGGTWRTILCVADQTVKRELSGKSWLAEACRHLSIEIIAIELPEHHREALKNAQATQYMTNSPHNSG